MGCHYSHSQSPVEYTGHYTQNHNIIRQQARMLSCFLVAPVQLICKLVSWARTETSTDCANSAPLASLPPLFTLLSAECAAAAAAAAATRSRALALSLSLSLPLLYDRLRTHISVRPVCVNPHSWRACPPMSVLGPLLHLRPPTARCRASAGGRRSRFLAAVYVAAAVSSLSCRPFEVAATAVAPLLHMYIPGSPPIARAWSGRDEP